MADWATYHQQTKERKPAPLLVKALSFVTKKEEALDLGSGALVESKFLLAEGFNKVVAIDIVPFEAISDERYSFVETSFEQYEFPEGDFDLVNAQFALPFTKSESFGQVWEGVMRTLKPGGIFSGQLFGARDSWSSNPAMTFRTGEEVGRLLKGLETIELTEIENDGKTASGEGKHWHIFRIIFRKL